jgi:histidinol-phosphate aminotransferase
MPTVFDSHDLCVPGVRALQPYQPGKPVSELEREYGVENVIKLASNESPLGPSLRAVAAAEETIRDLGRYPDGGGFLLNQALAEKHGVDPTCITLGNGSNDVLDMIARVFLMPGYNAVFSEYAFAVYPISVQAVGATARVALACNGDNGPLLGHNLVAMSDLVGDHTRVVFIANPNNPTGTWLQADELKSFISQLPNHVVVVVDEAYFEYVDKPGYPDASQWLDDYPNLVVTRTFSKAYGLAGLRVGYSLSQPAVADLLNRVRQPFNVNSVAQAAALAALEDGRHLEKAVRLNREGLRQLVTGLGTLGIPFVESAGNFVTVDTGRDAVAVYENMLRKGVIVRPVANYGLPNHLRISVGLLDENERLLNILGNVLEQVSA